MTLSFQPLQPDAIKPAGWLLEQITRDLESGFAGRLDHLTEHAANDLFRHRIASSQEQVAWWDAETRGNSGLFDFQRRPKYNSPWYGKS